MDDAAPCDWCGETDDDRVNLDGEELCRECANQWAKGEMTAQDWGEL